LKIYFNENKKYVWRDMLPFWSSSHDGNPGKATTYSKILARLDVVLEQFSSPTLATFHAYEFPHF
jgi:hypothetical protein